MQLSQEKVDAIRSLLAQGKSERDIASELKVNRRTVAKLRDNPNYPQPNQVVPVAHGEETKLPKAMHFNCEDTLVPTDQQIRYERCREYRGKEGCGGTKQVGAECLVCRDRAALEEKRIADLEWEEYLELLLGPSPHPLAESTIAHTPTPVTNIIIEDIAVVEQLSTLTGTTQIRPVEAEPAKVDKIINEVKSKFKNRGKKRK